MLLDLRMVQQLRCLTDDDDGDDDDDDYLSPQSSTGMTKTDADRWVTIKFDLSQLYGIMRVDLRLFNQPDRSFYGEVKDVQLERCTSICESSARTVLAQSIVLYYFILFTNSPNCLIKVNTLIVYIIIRHVLLELHMYNNMLALLIIISYKYWGLRVHKRSVIFIRVGGTRNS